MVRFPVGRQALGANVLRHRVLHLALIRGRKREPPCHLEGNYLLSRQNFGRPLWNTTTFEEMQGSSSELINDRGICAARQHLASNYKLIGRTGKPEWRDAAMVGLFKHGARRDKQPDT